MCIHSWNIKPDTPVILESKMSKIKHQDLVDYWSSRIYEGDLGTDWDEGHKRCWRCGYTNYLERCHIIPKSLDGLNTPDNLVLLCNTCHREAPDINDSDVMFDWIKRTRGMFYEEYRTKRTLQSFKDIFGDENYSNMKNLLKNKTAADFEDFMIETGTELGIHFGMDVKPSSIACALKKWMDSLKCI